MTEELTAEERVSLATDWPPHYGTLAKLLRLYDAALARAEAAEKELAATDRLLTDQCSKKWGAESALAEATALLLRIKAWADSPLGEAKEPWVCLHNALDAHLPRTPAPAAKAEPECCDGHSQSGAHQPGCPRTVDKDTGKVRRVDLIEPTLLERIEAECNDWEAHAFGNGAQSRLAMIHIRDLIRSSKQGGA
jgi:hypothetical protein